MSGTANPLNALLLASMDGLLVLVVTARPVAEFLARAAPLRRPIEKLPRAAEDIRAAVKGRVRVIDGPVLLGERAQAVQLHAVQLEAEVCREVAVEAARGGHPGEAPAHAPPVGEQPLQRRP